MLRLLVTGGAGFIGSSVALAVARARPDVEVTALDSLHRRGSELALPRLAAGGVRFLHGDVRVPGDLERAGAFDVVIDCAADPSVHAGRTGRAAAVVDTNLVGTVNCLEIARRHGASMIFLSTSRVYGIQALRDLPLERRGERWQIPDGASGPGWSPRGIRRDFSLDGFRSLYGATKLSAELLIEEYRVAYGLPAVVNRCGVVAGPWQMGKADQGVVALWAARHLWGEAIEYTGFGGDGLQVRDVLHVGDLCDLLVLQSDDVTRWSGAVLNVGGGPERSASLNELTELCARAAGRRIAIRRTPDTAPADVPFYVTDNQEVTARTGWAPRRSLELTVGDTVEWLRRHEDLLAPVMRGV